MDGPGVASGDCGGGAIGRRLRGHDGRWDGGGDSTTQIVKPSVLEGGGNQRKIMRWVN